MKTAMQELLEEVISERESSINVDFREALDFVKSAIEQDYLDKEKEQMVDFARNIIIDATCSVEGYVTTEKDIEDYYNETFNING
jgi:hypothetical protein